MNYLQIINRLIPADQLHWNEEEGKYSAICEEEAVKIWKKCDQLSEKEKIALIMWYQRHKVYQIMWENFMKGRVAISGVSGVNDGPIEAGRDYSPIYSPKEL